MRIKRFLLGALLLITLGMMALEPFATTRVIKAYNTENLVQLQAVTVGREGILREGTLPKSFYYRLLRSGNMALPPFEPPRC